MASEFSVAARPVPEEDAHLKALIVAITGGALLFIATFLPFVTASAGGLTTTFGGSGFSGSWNLWTDNSGIILTGLAAASIALAKGRLYLGLFATSAFAALDVLYERGTIISAKNSLLGAFVRLDVSWAFWLALMAAALIFTAAILGRRAGA